MAAPIKLVGFDDGRARHFTEREQEPALLVTVGKSPQLRRVPLDREDLYQLILGATRTLKRLDE